MRSLADLLPATTSLACRTTARSILACPERLRVGFYVHISSASPRAADTAAYDYADLGEKLLGFTAYIMLRVGSGAPTALVQQLTDRFGERVLGLSGAEIEDSLPLLQRHGVTYLYVYKFGYALPARPTPPSTLNLRLQV